MKKIGLLEWKLLQYLLGPNARLSFTHNRVWLHGEASKSVLNAALSLCERGCLLADRYNNYSLTERGREMASTPRPEWIPPKPPRLNSEDYHVLNNIGHGDWSTTQWVGGTNGSHHSASLAKLVRHGYVERQKGAGAIVTGDASVREPSLGRRPKGSCRYRITDKGREFLAEHREALN